MNPAAKVAAARLSWSPVECAKQTEREFIATLHRACSGASCEGQETGGSGSLSTYPGKASLSSHTQPGFSAVLSRTPAAGFAHHG